MAYGTLKVDNITYTSGGSDASTTVSGLVNGNFPNITITGTVSGATITGNTGNFTTITAVTGIFTSTLSGQTATGVTANFQSGVFTTQISGQTITGNQIRVISGTVESGLQVKGIITADQGVVATTSGVTISAWNLQALNSLTSLDTVTGSTGSFVTVTGTTVTGITANFSSGNYTGTLSGATTRDSAGNVRDIPQNAQTSGYTLVASDAGKHVFTVSGVTVPSGVFSVGQAVTIYNNTTGTITITQGTNVTLRQAGASGTGNRTLAQRGLATVLCVSGASGTEFVINGNIT